MPGFSVGQGPLKCRRWMIAKHHFLLALYPDFKKKASMPLRRWLAKPKRRGWLYLDFNLSVVLT
jgi:hypothetical protein